MSAKGSHRPGRHLVLFSAVIGALALFGRVTLATAAAPPGACDSAAVVARALPAVVNISVVKVVHETGTGPSEHLEVVVGSGVVIDPSGVIVTNQHVIQDAAVIRVTFNDRTQVSARLIQAAALIDLALLKVDVQHPLAALQFGNSGALQIGQPVIAVGNPLGIGTSVSTGVVSALDRNLMRTPFDDFIQTDAAINPGNSGGPLLDCSGDIVGINTALYSNNKMLGSIGLGFALPSNIARVVTNKLLNPETDSPDWFGLQLQDLTPSLATVFGRHDVSGAIITGTDPNSPAAQASLVPGDIITAVDGRPMPNARAILLYVTVRPPHAVVAFSIWQRDHTSEVKLQAQPWPGLMKLRSSVLASAASVERAEAEGLGLHLTTITEAERQRFGLSPDQSGILIDQVTPGTQAASVGLEAGNVIERVDDQPATTLSEVKDKLSHDNPAAGNLVALLVRGKINTSWVTLYVGRVDVAHLITAPPHPLSLAPTAAANAGAETHPKQ